MAERDRLARKKPAWRSAWTPARTTAPWSASTGQSRHDTEDRSEEDHVTPSRPRVGKLASRNDIEGLIALLGTLDRRDVQARFALIGMGAEAVPALLQCALSEETADQGAMTARAAAAHTVLVEIGEPTLRAVEHLIRTSDDARVTADAAALAYRTAEASRLPVAADVRREAESKTGATWAALTGAEPESGPS
jgi:hypothetical protein